MVGAEKRDAGDLRGLEGKPSGGKSKTGILLSRIRRLAAGYRLPESELDRAGTVCVEARGRYALFFLRKFFLNVQQTR